MKAMLMEQIRGIYCVSSVELLYDYPSYPYRFDHIAHWYLASNLPPSDRDGHIPAGFSCIDYHSLVTEIELFEHHLLGLLPPSSPSTDRTLVSRPAVEQAGDADEEMSKGQEGNDGRDAIAEHEVSDI